VILRIHREAADLPDDPVVRQLLRPGRIDREGRDIAGVGCAGAAMRAEVKRIKKDLKRQLRLGIGVMASSRFLPRVLPAWRPVNSGEVRESTVSDPSLRAQRSNPAFHPRNESWIASSLRSSQ
jgi:hypothetical protein